MSRPKLSDGEFTLLVKGFQRDAKLVDDGLIGPKTLTALGRLDETCAQIRRALANSCVLDTRSGPWEVKITSGYKTRNPDRPTHDGCDFFFRYHPDMGPAKIKDGEAAGSNNKLKWFIPRGTKALCLADGVVQSVRLLKTGLCIYVRHAFEGGVWWTSYMHLISALVKAGDTIHQNDALGEVGDNPIDNDARHLHAQLSIGTIDNTVDPQLYLPSRFSL